jgi:hypothetical protein
MIRIIPALLHPEAEGIDTIYQHFSNDARQNTALNGRGVKGIFPDPKDIACSAFGDLPPLVKKDRFVIAIQ